MRRARSAAALQACEALVAVRICGVVCVYIGLGCGAAQVFGLNVMFLVTSILSAIGSVLTLLSSFKVNLKRKPAFHLVSDTTRCFR